MRPIAADPSARRLGERRVAAGSSHAVEILRQDRLNRTFRCERGSDRHRRSLRRVRSPVHYRAIGAGVEAEDLRAAFGDERQDLAYERVRGRDSAIERVVRIGFAQDRDAVPETHVVGAEPGPGVVGAPGVASRVDARRALRLEVAVVEDLDVAAVVHPLAKHRQQ